MENTKITQSTDREIEKYIEIFLWKIMPNQYSSSAKQRLFSRVFNYITENGYRTKEVPARPMDSHGYRAVLQLIIFEQFYDIVKEDPFILDTIFEPKDKNVFKDGHQ